MPSPVSASRYPAASPTRRTRPATRCRTSCRNGPAPRTSLAGVAPASRSRTAGNAARRASSPRRPPPRMLALPRPRMPGRRRPPRRGPRHRSGHRPPESRMPRSSRPHRFGLRCLPLHCLPLLCLPCLLPLNCLPLHCLPLHCLPRSRPPPCRSTARPGSAAAARTGDAGRAADPGPGTAAAASAARRPRPGTGPGTHTRVSPSASAVTPASSCTNEVTRADSTLIPSDSARDDSAACNPGRRTPRPSPCRNGASTLCTRSR